MSGEWVVDTLNAILRNNRGQPCTASRLWAVAGSFLLLFLAFEVLHPVGDLLGAENPYAAATGRAAEPGHHGEGTPFEAHGPFLGNIAPISPPPSGRRERPPPSVHLPESPFLEPSSPVPIVPVRQA